MEVVDCVGCWDVRHQNESRTELRKKEAGVPKPVSKKGTHRACQERVRSVETHAPTPKEQRSITGVEKEKLTDQLL